MSKPAKKVEEVVWVTELTRAQQKEIVNLFHQVYYDSAYSHTEKWFGTALHKCPLDLWIYQEIIHEIRPDWIIETGTGVGGSAKYLASICNLIGHGSVLTIDVHRHEERCKALPNVHYLIGHSTSARIIDKVSGFVNPSKQRIMVILDSYHHRDHVLQELDLYSPFVTFGSYLIVEDTNLDSNPLLSGPDFPGPMKAIDAWLPNHHEFGIDHAREKLLMTYNPSGYLRRIA